MANTIVDTQKHAAVIEVDFAESATQSSPGVYIGHAKTGLLQITSEFNGDSITYQISDTLDGTYVGVEDNGGTAIAAQTVAQNTYIDVPSQVMQGMFLKVTTGSATAAAATIKLIVKS